MIKKIFFILMIMVLNTAFADFRFIVPQKPGDGTSLWVTIVAGELEKKLGEKIIIEHIPGARDKFGFEKFHNELRMDPQTVMVSHGGNAVSFLQEKVSYNYADYAPVAIMHNNIIVSKNKKLNPDKDTIIFSLHSGTEPEAMALALLVDGKNAWKSWGKRVKAVKGMSQAENRLAFRREEVNMTRENPAAHMQHVAPVEMAEIYFHHGLYNFKKDIFEKDPNFPDAMTFEELYENKWKEKPSGKLYQAYRMVKAWRDGLQKALWVNKENPNLPRLRDAVAKMLADPEAHARIQEKLGKYPWEVGDDASAYLQALFKLISKDSLQTLVDFNNKALGLDTYFNKERLNK